MRSLLLSSLMLTACSQPLQAPDPELCIAPLSAAQVESYGEVAQSARTDAGLIRAADVLAADCIILAARRRAGAREGSTVLREVVVNQCHDLVERLIIDKRVAIFDAMAARHTRSGTPISALEAQLLDGQQNQVEEATTRLVQGFALRQVVDARAGHCSAERPANPTAPAPTVEDGAGAATPN